MEKSRRCPHRTHERRQRVCRLNLLVDGGLRLGQRLLSRLQRLFSSLFFVASSLLYCPSGNEHSVSSCGHDRHPFGFNRRHSPLIAAMRAHFDGRTEPLAMIYRVNALRIPLGSAAAWVHDPEVGGGRIVGAACHFIDTMQVVIYL